MAGSKNDTQYSRGYNIYPTTSAETTTLQLISDATQLLNVSGNPNGVVPANPASLAQDRTNGALYLKVSGTGTTTWEQVATGADVPTQFTTDSGIATVSGNNINLLGQNLAGSGIQTSGSGSTVTHRMISPYSLSGFLFDGGDLSVIRSSSGGQVISQVANSSNTASSDARLKLQVAGASAGNAYIDWDILATRAFSMGIDNVDDNLKITNSNTFTGAGSTFYSLSNIGQSKFYSNTDAFPVVSGNGISSAVNTANTSIRGYMRTAVPANIVAGFGSAFGLFAQDTSSNDVAVFELEGVMDTVTVGAVNTHADFTTYLANSPLSSASVYPRYFKLSAGQVVAITTPGVYPYTTLQTDYVILVDTSSARTIVPMASPVTGQTYRIKDNVGSAAANNITITPSGKNIDGSASATINANYGSIDIVYNGAQWNIL